MGGCLGAIRRETPAWSANSRPPVQNFSLTTIAPNFQASSPYAVEFSRKVLADPRLEGTIGRNRRGFAITPGAGSRYVCQAGPAGITPRWSDPPSVRASTYLCRNGTLAGPAGHWENTNWYSQATPCTRRHPRYNAASPTISLKLIGVLSSSSGGGPEVLIAERGFG